MFNQPNELIEQPVARIKHVRRRDVWRLYWQVADGRWRRYEPCLETDSLAKALRIIDEDGYGCFFG